MPPPSIHTPNIKNASIYLPVISNTSPKAQAASAANGDLFCDYQTRLFGDSGAGFGELYQYEFVSADLNKQPLVGPTAAAGCWAIVLPDPELAAEKPDGTVLTNPQSTLVYALPANLP